MSAALQNQLMTMPPLTDDLVEILGRPSFNCTRIAQALRLGGHEIKSKAEHEQAHAIHYLMNQYLAHGANWFEKTNTALKDMETDAKAAKTNGRAKKRITGKHHMTFTAPMILSLLDGRKTQMRERIYPAPQMITDNRCVPWEGDPAALMQLLEKSPHRCPYGMPGDQIWVQETWRTDSSLDDNAPGTFNGWPVKYEADGRVMRHDAFYGNTDGKTRASIHMPRWASRILLEIVSVRVERLADISEADAIAEGVDPALDPLHCPVAGTQNHWRNYQAQAGSNREWSEDSPIKSFQTLWQQLEGPCIWLTNPWVWVIEFKEIS